MKWFTLLMNLIQSMYTVQQHHFHCESFFFSTKAKARVMRMERLVYILGICGEARSARLWRKTEQRHFSSSGVLSKAIFFSEPNNLSSSVSHSVNRATVNFLAFD